MTKKLILISTMSLSLVASCVAYGYFAGLSADEIVHSSYFLATGAIIGWIIRNAQGPFEEPRSGDTSKATPA